ncbi:hypothetical protein BYZ73_11630 [Rhodovulum viride]|uniref:Uncharacterized protein n=1 Tax=Rhodovulum viride TaxID=1231134 RepID=A0ABX9DIF4_9RHOB|nr:hypothetical protein [Rhodovulum viride]RAP41077.1 hypothetical protein BYZ73_11630 [Rhodovulum viride]
MAGPTMNAEEALLWALGSDMPQPPFMLNTLTMNPPMIAAETSPGHRRMLQEQLDRAVEQANALRAQEEAEVFDLANGGAACDCAPGEPCCLKEFVIEDAGDASRKVTWPVPENGPRTLFLTCKDPYGGQPSAKARLKITSKEDCKQGKAGVPSLRPSNFADDNSDIPDSDERIVTTPFQMPALSGKILPPEVITAVYILGLAIQTSTYRAQRNPAAGANQCVGTGFGGLTVCPLPHAKLEAELEGSVGITIFSSRLPTLSAKLTGKITGEVGNQALEFEKSGEAEEKQAPPTRAQERQQQGESTPLISFIEDIQDAMNGLAGESGSPDALRAPQSDAFGSSIGIELKLGLKIGNLELKGKEASPDLSLTLSGCEVTYGLSVTGKMDLLDLFLSRFPRGPEIRRRLANPGNAVSASAQCAIEVGGAGDLSYGIGDIASLTIGNADDWEARLEEIEHTFTAKARITGKVFADARLEAETWFFKAEAAAGASVSTGWHFGGRVVRSQGGGRKTEKLYHFEGVVLRAYATVSVSAAASKSDSSSDVFGDYASTSSVSGGVTAKSNLAEPDYTLEIMSPEGEKDGWI